MKIYIGADHRGYEKKELVKRWLMENGHEVVDVGASEYDKSDDYVDYAVATVSSMGDADMGILMCGSGHGMVIAANRFSKVRAILGFNKEVVVQGRKDEDANVLILPAEWITDEEMLERASVFLETPFSGAERHVRRIKKIRDLRTKMRE